jgi:hypothetical protein
MKRRDVNAGKGYCTKPPRSRPAQERAAALERYLSSTESPSYGGFLEFAGLLEDTLTIDIRDAMNAADLVSTSEGETTRTAADILKMIEGKPHVSKLKPTKEQIDGSSNTFSPRG